MLSAGAGSEVSSGQCAWKLVPFARSSLVVLLPQEVPQSLGARWLGHGGLTSGYFAL